MKINQGDAELLEELMLNDTWALINEMFEERRAKKIQHLIEARHTYEEYVELSASIRELDYLRSEPERLIKKSYQETYGGNRPA